MKAELAETTLHPFGEPLSRAAGFSAEWVWDEVLPGRREHAHGFVDSWISDADALLQESTGPQWVDADAVSERYKAEIVEPVFVSRSWPRQESVEVLSKWEGSVNEVSADSFTAVVRDLAGNDPDHEVEFDLDEVSTSDRPLLMPGAVFYWTIGYRDRQSGQRVRESVIRFRRLPVRSEADAARRRAEGQRVAEELGWVKAATA